MAYSIRTLLVLTFAIALTLVLAPKFMAVLIFILSCAPLILFVFRFHKIRQQIGRTGVAISGLLAFAFAYIAFAGPWLMYTTYHGCATPFYGIPTPICDAVEPFSMNVMAPIMEPATITLNHATINSDYDPALGTSASNFDPAGWYTCEWMRYGMLLLTDEPPF